MEYYQTKIENFLIRQAIPEDAGLILQFVRALAEYEKLADQVFATEEILREWIFEKQRAEVLIGELNGRPVGFMLFFYNFSTFLGRAGIYLEDLYVRPEARGKGLGKEMLRLLSALAVERGCGRLEWSCLDWNEPSIRFYRSLGAKPVSGWTVYRLSGEALYALGNEKSLSEERTCGF